MPLKAHIPKVTKVNNRGMFYYQSAFDKVILAFEVRHPKSIGQKT
jgi:hypothetical protein